MNDNIIYGVRTGDTYHYIGKTKSKKLNNGNINKSEVRLYGNQKLRPIAVHNEDVIIEPLLFVDKWHTKKIEEVVKKHKDNHPLQNAQWLLDGNNGYWSGKTRDLHTVSRLSESKFIKVCQYDSQGNLMKIWGSVKEPAQKIFGDYEVIKGSGNSCLYGVLDSIKFDNRFKHNSYWFRSKELYDNFNCIPKKLHIDKLVEYQKQHSKHNRKPSIHINALRYTIVHYNTNGTIKATYKNSEDAAYKLKTTRHIIQRFCRGIYVNNDYILKYGEKIKQLINPVYPKYETILINVNKDKYKEPIKQHIKTKKVRKQYVKTKTTTRIEWHENDILKKVFISVKDVANFFNIKENAIRYICRKKNDYLRYGEKVQRIVE